MFAHTHPLSQLSNIQELVRRVKSAGGFKKALRQGRHSDTRDRLSPTEVRVDPKDLSIEGPSPQEYETRKQESMLLRSFRRLISLACFRGLMPSLTVNITIWILAYITDSLLSGQPPQYELGYGTASILFRSIFASASALQTHICITNPSRKRVFDRFPKGGEALVELWPLAALSATAEHLCLSVPLALSRACGLKEWAFDPESWNRLFFSPSHPSQLKLVLGQFAAVWGLYILLTATVAVTMTMIMRRVHVSMLSDEDMAIVPLPRGKQLPRSFDYDKRSEIKLPSLLASEAFESITVRQYLRVLGVYLLFWGFNQVVHATYWVLNRTLQEWLGVQMYPSTRLPWPPVVKLNFMNGWPDVASAVRSEL